MTSPSPQVTTEKLGFSVTSATIIFVVTVCAIILGLQSSRILEQRNEALAAGKTDTLNLVMSLTQHANLAFRSADTILNGLVERLQAQDHERSGGTDRLRNWLLIERENLPQIASFSVADRTGQLFISSERERPNASVSDREHFRHHLDKDSKQIFVGPPVFSRVLERWTIPASRRYNDAAGNFAGVAIALLEMDYFQKFYEQFDLGRQGTIILMSGNARLLARRPFVESNIGRDVSTGPIYKASREAPSGTIEVTAVVDGVTRINSYQLSEQFPLLVAVAKEKDEVLKPWWNRAIRETLQTVTLLLILALVGFFVWKTANQLSQAKRHLDAAINAMPQGLAVFDAERRIVISNARFAEIYGYPTELLQAGTPLGTILADMEERGVKIANVKPDQYAEEIAPDASESHFSLNGRLISIERRPTPEGGWVATHTDVTDQRRAELIFARQAADLRRINEYFETAINNMPQGICLFDAEQRVIIANSRYAGLYKLGTGEVSPGTPLQQILDCRLREGTNLATAPEIYRTLNVKKSHEIQDLADGRVVSISRSILSSGGWLTMHEDITERQKGERKIAYLAAHDPLTGLKNRVSFIDALEETTASSASSESSAAVFLLDLDRFKTVNDTLGHPAGDRLLREVASRLRAAVREQDTVARLGGDEFAIIQRLQTRNHEPAISLALRIIDVIRQPFDLDGHLTTVGTSIGIALCPEQGLDPAELMKKADLAMYAVKADGRNNFRIYDAEMMKVVEKHRLLEIELSQAIEHEEFELHYQPILDTKTRTIRSAEALVRWNHPQRGLLPPDQFIPLAEESGLIAQLGEWVLQRGCQDAAAWPADQKIAINLSAHQFKPGNLFEMVLCTLVESGLAPDRLELEITETALLENEPEHLHTLRRLKNIGVTIVLDDFGTGYSSAGYLTRYPFDKIKIDKSFVQKMATQRESLAIVSSTLALAQGLGIAVTAEGIETPEQLKQLCDAGVDFAQGYLIGRPMTLADFMSDNRQHPARIVA